MNPDQVQLRSRIRGVVCGIAVERGTIFWIDEKRAEWLIAEKAAEPVGQLVVGPAEIKDPSEKKSYPAAPAGPSTDSAPSSAPGTATSLFASPEAPAPRTRRPRRLKLTGTPDAGESA